MSDSHRIAQLEGQVRRLRATVIFATVIPLGLTLVAFEQGARSARFAQIDADTIRTHNIIVVDTNNVERVRIAGPLPDPIMLGKRYNRGESVSGIIIYDAEGNERGGYVTDDFSGAAALTLDEMMRAAVHIGASARGESHITFSNGIGGFGGMGIRMDTGPFFRMDNAAGATVITADSVYHEVRK